jgi:hypothetical protein
VIPFGLENAPTKFHRVMYNALKQYLDRMIVYIDDILVFSNSIKQHFKHLTIFLLVIKRDGLVVSKRKMELFKTNIKFLGHILANGQLALQQHVVEFADKFPNKITNKNQLQIFLGSLNYVNHFYKDCAKDKNILNDGLKKDPSPWTYEYTKEVQNIKKKVKTVPILYVADDNFPKIVETDANNLGWGEVLKQVRKYGKRSKEEII